MNLATLLSPERVDCRPETSSKKRALEALSAILVQSDPALTQDEVFNALISRERLGSTGLGRGVAIPHGRLARISAARIALIKLGKGVDYDAPDSQPVDILFALIAPEESTDEHLQILAHLAKILSDKHFCNRLREQPDRQRLHALVTGWSPPATL